MSGYFCCEHCAQAANHEPWGDGHDDPCAVSQCHGADWHETPTPLITTPLITLRPDEL